MIRPRATLIIVFLCTLLLPALGQRTASPAFARAHRKIQWIEENGRREHPSTVPTVLTAAEWNAYLNEGGVKLPEGITAVHVSSQRGVANAEAEIDFDRLTANRTRSNPLLQLFTGKHHVTATAGVSVAAGVATVHVQSIQFDGTEIPRFALEYFAARFLRPKYGNAIGMDSTFPLRNRIDSAVAGTDRATIIQR
jgi:hypothetical protein